MTFRQVYSGFRPQKMQQALKSIYATNSPWNYGRNTDLVDSKVCAPLMARINLIRWPVTYAARYAALYRTE